MFVDKNDIIRDLRTRVRALRDQSELTSEDAEKGGDEEVMWDAEVGAKLELAEDLLELYTKPKKRKR
jgi:hypothetical protein